MSTIVGASQLASQSKVVKYNLKLQRQMLIKDVWTMNSGLYNRKTKEWPKNKTLMRVTGNAATEESITWKRHLYKTGVYGQTTARGTEELPETMNLRIYENNVRKVIPKPGYGLRKLEAEKYKLYEEHEADLVPWNQEQLGWERRMGFLERYGFNLTQGDTAALATQWWNPNIFIPTAGLSGNPAFSRDRATHTSNIAAVMQSTGGVAAQRAARTLTAPVVEDLSNWALNKRITKMKLPEVTGGMGYVLLISELTAGYLSNPTYVANNLGAISIAKDRFTNETYMRWPGAIGYYNDILFVCDPRIPTVKFSGSAAPWSMSAHYMLWDSLDQRQRGVAGVHDTAFLLGENSLVEMEGEPIHYISDSQDYDFNKGVGTACVRGCQLPIFLDQETTDIRYYGGAVCILDLPNGGAQAA